jgi:hypothetical protein
MHKKAPTYLLQGGVIIISVHFSFLAMLWSFIVPSYCICSKLTDAALVRFGLDTHVRRRVLVCRFAHLQKKKAAVT